MLYKYLSQMDSLSFPVSFSWKKFLSFHKEFINSFLYGLQLVLQFLPLTFKSSIYQNYTFAYMFCFISFLHKQIHNCSSTILLVLVFSTLTQYAKNARLFTLVSPPKKQANIHQYFFFQP